MSTRYVPAILALVALALVPTIVHTYVGVVAADGHSTAVIPWQLDGVAGIDTNRSAAWVKETFGADDFIERRYAGATLFVARSYDAKRLYHHPELGVAYGIHYETARVIRIPSPSGEIALHLLEGDRAVAAYAVVHDGTFVEDPIRFQVRQALSMLVNPRKPTTLFFAHSSGASPPAESPAVRVVVAAVESFMTQTPLEPR